MRALIAMLALGAAQAALAQEAGKWSAGAGIGYTSGDYGTATTTSHNAARTARNTRRTRSISLPPFDTKLPSLPRPYGTGGITVKSYHAYRPAAGPK